MIPNYLKNKRILLVDDEPELRDMVRSILLEEGFTNLRTAGSVRPMYFILNWQSLTLCFRTETGLP